MSERLPRVVRTTSRITSLTWILIVVIVALGAALAVLIASGPLAGRSDDAERDYRLLTDGLKENPDDPAVLMTLAETEYRMGKVTDALRHAKKSVDKAGDTPGYRLRYAGLLLQEHQEKAAKPLVEDEIALGTPGDPEPYFLLAQIEWNLRDDAAALENMSKGLAIAPQAADMIILYADMLAESGDEDAALAQYREALRFLPGDSRAEQGIRDLGGVPPVSEEATSPHDAATGE